MIESLKKHAKPFHSINDFDPLMDAIGNAKYVLLGESSHGTSEFYTIRAELTKRLILEKGFSFIAVEGDWPACQSINRYIKGLSPSNKDVREVLEAFNRWPAWMWANQEIVGLVDWLKEFNINTNRSQKVGFYGLDVYSLWESLDEIIGFLTKLNSPELEAAKKAFACFEPHNRNNESYAVSAGYLSEDCMKEALDLLSTIQNNKWKFEDALESSLNMEVNALVTAHAEEYYRTMVKSDDESWNIRDRHMVDALNSIREFYGSDAKVIVWEHNTHVGDARATDMKNEGMVNVGQLVREHYGEDEVFIVGFGTYTGTVIASPEWGLKPEVMSVPPAQHGSWEYLMHQAGAINQFLIFNDQNRKDFSSTVGHRAIGVVYHPEYEQFGNYVPSNMGNRYDGFIFVDRTNALHPLVLERVLI
ncbi:erythromycin esterase family protein [Neobacillus drentensis]|uniref:erythromycin esterase family protein n=1 Tax=Neobacillus drentensis TaxID=220684 RepID=UPI002FFD9226